MTDALAGHDADGTRRERLDDGSGSGGGGGNDSTSAMRSDDIGQESRGSPRGGPHTARSGGGTMTGEVNATQASRPTQQIPDRRRQCRFFLQSGGCRAGASCPFRHDSTTPLPTRPKSAIGSRKSAAIASSISHPTSQAVKESAPSNIVSKPKPNAPLLSPKDFQIRQIALRYHPSQKILGNGSSVLEFGLKPSDPDFPFDIERLECQLIVSKDWPDDEDGLKLKVKSKDIPRGYSINIETGFDNLVQAGVRDGKQERTLLELAKALDRNLEAFLQQKEAEVVTLVGTVDRRHLNSLPTHAFNPHKPSENGDKPKSPHLGAEAPSIPRAPEEVPKPRTKPPPQEYFSAALRATAKESQDSEIRQLEARLGRLPNFRQTTTGTETVYTVPVIVPQRPDIPASLQTLRLIKVHVPELYPLKSCWIKLENQGHDARLAEKGFYEWIRGKENMPLLGKINGVVQNLATLTALGRKLEESFINDAKEDAIKKAEESIAIPPEEGAAAKGKQLETIPMDLEDDKKHIRFVPRPEQIPPTESDSENEFDDDDEEYSSDFSGGVSFSHSDTEGAQNPAASSSSDPHRGTSLNFPTLSANLYSISLLELTTLNLSVTCIRCKAVVDIHSIQTEKTEQCPKCRVNLTVAWRKELMHMSSSRAGYIDLSGCRIASLLYSTYTLTCSSCNEPQPPLSLFPETPTHKTCRHCFAKLTINLPEPKFLRITPSLAATSAAKGSDSDTRPHRRRAKYRGRELPDLGTCTHYKHSHRHLLFPCCGHSYACDKCHDDSENHVAERAERMLCGFCGREQIFRPDDCRYCGRLVVGKEAGTISVGKTSGFWEGGTGTRDKVRMRRGERRKWMRTGNKEGKKEGKKEKKDKE